MRYGTDAQWCPISRKWCTCDKRCEDDNAVHDYAERMIRREQTERLEGDPDKPGDDTRGNPIKR